MNKNQMDMVDAALLEFLAKTMELTKEYVDRRIEEAFNQPIPGGAPGERSKLFRIGDGFEPTFRRLMDCFSGNHEALLELDQSRLSLCKHCRLVYARK